MEVYRTPADRLADLADFPYESRYRSWDGLQLAYLDEGDGPPVVMLHGEMTWSYLFRGLLGPLLRAGYRCVVPDLVGFGRSDKPLDPAWYSYDRHVAAMASLLEQLDLRDVTLLMHDWGGPIGLRIATTALRDRITRFVIMDTFVLTGEEDMGDAWAVFRDLAKRPDFPVGRIVRMGCEQHLPREIVAAYDAPFPTPASKAALRAFPRLIPRTHDDPAAVAGREIMSALADDQRPVLAMWAEADPIFPREQFAHHLLRTVPSVGDLEIVPRAGHFLCEDQGEYIGNRVVQWLGA
jgi:haloalkane dehalogenase